MKIRYISLIALAAVILAVVFVLVFSSLSERRETARKAARLVEEGFLVLEGNPDEAVRLALTARKIDGNNIEALILLGRANFLKGRYTDTVKIFEEAMNGLQDLDLAPELSYYIGMAHFNLFKETGVREDWTEAFKHLSEAARLGEHVADANIALGGLYATKDYFDREKILLYWERAFRFEKDLDGYPGSGGDGACPYCRQKFKKWRDQEVVSLSYERLKAAQ